MDKVINNKNSSKYKTLKITYTKNKLSLYWSPLFLVLWGLLFVFVIFYVKHILPTPLTIDDEINNTDSFIAERAERNLQVLTRIGPRMVGSAANEQAAVQFLMDEVSKIKNSASNSHDIEMDIQVSTGSYLLFNMVNMYQGIQNVVVKVSPRNSRTTAALLINSHFDTVHGSPGAGDDGTMVVVMLEVLRILTRSENPLKHNVIFLFNGAEENPLQGSHAFITQHKWAVNVKAFINLDSAGNGGREILFQSGPSHPWLMKYYRDNAKHPFASTIAEEMFQNKLIPSDTDFRIFRDYGHIPGLDFAHSSNGYVYHTKFDRATSVPRGTLQNTGNNILEITRALANADELENPEAHAEGHTIFYDFLGLYMIFYTNTEGIIINIVVCVVAVIGIIISICLMKRNSGLFWKRILIRFGVIFIIQFVSIILAIALPIAIACFLDVIGYSQSWYSETWLIFGLYFCSVFFGLGLIPVIYLGFTKENGLPLNYKIQMFMHSHCILLIILTVAMTVLNIRSAFIFMTSIFFYTISMLINVSTTLQGRSFSWIISIILGQILPFLFYSYMALVVLSTFIPMAGRDYGIKNPEILISLISIVFGILLGGFLVPLCNIFRRSKLLVSLFGILSLVFIILTVTPVGFPYKAETSFQRYWIFHTRRIFHDYDNTIKANESGYYVHPFDRRSVHTVKDIVLNMSLAESTGDLCGVELNCGLPLYNSRMHAGKQSSLWIPASTPVLIRVPVLRNLRRQLVSSTEVHHRLKYEYSLSGPDHMSIFIQPKPDCKLVHWTFNDNSTIEKLSPPYFIYFSYGSDPKALKFSLEFEKNVQHLSAPCFDIAISGHLNHHTIYQTEDFRKFLRSFPDWTDLTAWMSSYESFKV